jgi:uncharacterized protein (TIGR00661 family)
VKIFYGVQGTGNGHITRARAIAPKLAAAGADVTWLFTGRKQDGFCEMEVFGDFLWREGLTFQTRHGNVQYINTALKNNLVKLVSDIRSLDLSGYDLVISDFEPVTAWAARLRGIKSLGIGHQYAFGKDIPVAGADFMGVQVLKWFAPVTVGVGVHWHHFNDVIIPPIIQTDVPRKPAVQGKMIVYLPFEEVSEIQALLKPFDGYEFHVYHPKGDQPVADHYSHIQIKPVSRQAFQDDFADCAGVICNAGFELPSEALHFGKKLLVKPLHGQMEQLSNALALDQLNLGRVMHDLEAGVVESWLESGVSHNVQYPDVPQAIADWIMQGDHTVTKEWVQSIWDRCQRIN